MQLDLSVARELGVAHLDQYFGLWAVDETRFLSMFERINAMDLRAHIEQRQIEPEAAISVNPNRIGAIAVIDIQGTMTKHGSSLSEGGSTIRIRREIRVAAADGDVAGILLRIDSPGGTVAGTADLAADVFAARKVKPVFAFIEDFGASAAYWVASQATKVFANDRTAFIGSIGTFFGLYDFSKAFENEGIKPVPIMAGKFKGTGFPGTEITPEQQAMIQSLVEKIQVEFNAGIQRGRGMNRKQVEQLADGRIHVAPDALEFELIDGIQSFDATIKQLAREPALQTGRKSTQETPSMDTQTTEPQPASIAELQAAFPDDSKFALDCAAKGSTLPEAKADFCGHLQARLQNRDATIAKLGKEKTELAAAAAKKPHGATPVTDDADDSAPAGDPVATVNARVQQLVDNGVERHKAHKRVMSSDPVLRMAYVNATCQEHSRPQVAAAG